MSASPRFSHFDVYIFYLYHYGTDGRKERVAENDVPLGHAWQKMMCLFTDRRGIDAKPRSR